MSRLDKRHRVALLIGVAYVLLFAVWALRPLHETMPVGIDYTPTLLNPPQGERLVRVDIRCSNVFGSSPRPDEPLPELTPQPEGKPALAYGRTPCEFVQRDARMTVVVDAVLVMIVLGVFVFVRRRRPPDHDTRVSGEQTSPAC